MDLFPSEHSRLEAFQIIARRLFCETPNCQRRLWRKDQSSRSGVHAEGICETPSTQKNSIRRASRVAARTRFRLASLSHAVSLAPTLVTAIQQQSCIRAKMLDAETLILLKIGTATCVEPPQYELSILAASIHWAIRVVWLCVCD